VRSLARKGRAWHSVTPGAFARFPAPSPVRFPMNPSPKASEPEPGAVCSLARYVWGAMPRRAAAAVALTFAVSGSEAVSVLLLIQLLGVVGLDLPGASVGGVGSAAWVAMGWVGLQPTLGTVLAVYVAAVAALAFFQRQQTLVATRVDQDTATALRTRLYAAATRARWLPLTRIRTSDLLHALTTEATRSGNAAGTMLSLATQLLIGVVYLGFALRISVAATLVTLGCGAAGLLLLRAQRRRISATGEELNRAAAAVVGAATEHLQAVKTVKSYGAEARNVAIFSALVDRARDAQTRAARSFADARAGLAAGSTALMAVVTWTAIRGLDIPGGVVLLLIFIFSRLVPRLHQMQTAYQELRFSVPSFVSVRGWIDRLEREGEGAADAADPPPPLLEGIRLESVSFAYAEGQRDSVSGVELTIPARRTTALVGTSGAGKTTIADLVMGLVTPRAGRITVDGRVLDESWVRAWRGAIGYVAQDTLLFHDSVLANVRWAHPAATDDEVWTALRDAAADGFVAALPEGIHTVIGDRGVRMSGGERQRLALARALLRRPTLLILDEATSALDVENERRIRAAIDRLHGTTTILIITHRLASVHDADTIHVFESGSIVESGDWGTLLATPGGRFRELWGKSRDSRD